MATKTEPDDGMTEPFPSPGRAASPAGALALGLGSALLLLVSCRPLATQTSPPDIQHAHVNAIFIDGHFDDWASLAPIAVDSETVAGSAVQLDSLWATDDAAWLYLSFAVSDFEQQADTPFLERL